MNHSEECRQRIKEENRTEEHNRYNVTLEGLAQGAELEAAEAKEDSRKADDTEINTKVERQIRRRRFFAGEVVWTTHGLVTDARRRVKQAINSAS